jgi:hypothetical protein
MPGRDVEVARFVADTTKARTLLALEHPDDTLQRLSELIAPIADGVQPKRAASGSMAV